MPDDEGTGPMHIRPLGDLIEHEWSECVCLHVRRHVRRQPDHDHPADLHPCPDMSCPHCPCTYTTECCYCDGTRTPLEDS